MRIILLIILLSISCNINALFSNGIIQIKGDEPAYIISVKHGGEPIGDIKIMLFPDVAPKHCRNFDSLVGIKFYDGTAFHRVIPNFMIQGGDPNSINKPKNTWGYGDPSQRKIPAEFSELKHLRGIMSAARAQDINSATSQFFICVRAASHLDGKYSIYGEVTEGMDIVDYVVNVPRDGNDNPLEKVEMIIIKDPEAGVVDVKHAENQINLYPNPAERMISFRTDLNIIAESIKILDLNGNLIREDFFNLQNISDIHLNVSYLNSGIYYIQIYDISSDVYNLKIVVNR